MGLTIDAYYKICRNVSKFSVSNASDSLCVFFSLRSNIYCSGSSPTEPRATYTFMFQFALAVSLLIHFLTHFNTRIVIFIYALKAKLHRTSTSIKIQYVNIKSNIPCKAVRNVTVSKINTAIIE